MRTNIVLDDELIRKGFKYTGIKTKKNLVDFALRELIKQNERKRIGRLKGKGHGIEDISPLVKELSGVIRLKKGQDIKKDYTDYLIKKYQ